ncbi:hypothetical protein KFK09_011248 [Dendrobium nobile]|uniref:Uncharacterized protein n=1 Tax=Dendrobium nobile TaxID=94219 RepID=A0A8T3BEE8_DENNO|nr:hypothetical protein KFK09_011248 [Dendrobium nobile]
MTLPKSCSPATQTTPEIVVSRFDILVYTQAASRTSIFGIRFGFFDATAYFIVNDHENSFIEPILL